MSRQNLLLLIAMTTCAAFLLAANQQTRPDGWNVLSVYGYWFVRISIEATLFFAFFLLVGLIPALNRRKVAALCLAGLASYLPFVLSVTAMDIVLGLPELGSTVGTARGPDPQVGAFLLELGYLLDNHAFLCGLLSLPLLAETRMIVSIGKHTNVAQEALETTSEELADGGSLTENLQGHASFFESLSPPFTGTLLRAEAQEHYVKLVGTSETRMILYRFSDILRELPQSLGMQVHRSHWIANEAIRKVVRKGNNTRIETQDGMQIPVSRRYVSRVTGWAEQNSAKTGSNDSASTA